MFTTTAKRTTPEARTIPSRLLTTLECLCGKQVDMKRSMVNKTISQGDARPGIDVAISNSPQLFSSAALEEKSSFMAVPATSKARFMIRFKESLIAENRKYTANACGANLSRRIRKKRHVFPITPIITIQNSATRIDSSASSKLLISGWLQWWKDGLSPPHLVSLPLVLLLAILLYLLWKH